MDTDVPRPQVVICGECGSTFPDFKTCEDHMSQCSDSKDDKADQPSQKTLSTCSYCELTFGDSSLLKEHIKEHHAPQLYTCDVCNLQTDVNTELWMHKVL